jgi:hypothetical protein
MMDEMMCPCDSPGSVSVMLIIAPIQRSESERAADTGQTTDVPRGFLRSEASAPNWLAAESVWVPMAAASFNPIRVQTHCQSPTAMHGRQHDCSRVRAMTDCKPSCQALVSGDRMWAGRERAVANCETNAVQRDEKPNSLRTLLVPRPLESRLHSNAQVRKRS